MITSKKIKEIAKNLGADLCGIASMDRFEGAPVQMDPRYIFPGAKSLIMLGYRIPRGSLRGIEEGTFFINYPSMGYAGINLVYGPVVLWNLNRILEDEGYETVPIANMNGAEALNPLTGNFRKGWSMSVDGKKPHPDILIHYRIAAFCAGLGEIGYSRLFLTPEFGPRNRFNLLLTAAPLEPDPIYEGPKLCDRCMLCVKNCTTCALSKTETEKVRVAGHDLEWAKINPYACETGISGGEHQELNPFIGDFPHQYGYGRAVEGAFGCMRACMVHLEERGVLKKHFSEPFRTMKPWRINHENAEQIAPIVQEQYIDMGKVEDADEYVKYNKTSNYANEKGASSGLGLGKDSE